MPPTRTYAAGSFITSAKAQKAEHPSNQPAIDRLQKIRETAAANNSHYARTVSRAMSSLAACSHAVETRKQALDLKGVGQHIAKIIVPKESSGIALLRSSSLNSTASSSTATSNDSNNSKKRTKQTKLLSREESLRVLSKPQPSAKQVAHDKAVAEAEQLTLKQSGWKAILLLDGREWDRDHVQAKLQMSGVPCEQRHLPIGDMAWIARSGQQEVMLGTIVERKTAADLTSSLFGTRYLEQRLRLQHCGLSQKLLLVEGDLASVNNCPADTLKMAMMETRIQLNFQIVQTRHLDDTVKFLKGVHRRILQRSFPSAFGELSTSSLPSFRSPDAQPRPRKKTKRSLVDMIMDTPPKPPLGAERLMTYSELKAKIERDREAGTKTVGAIHLAMLKQIPTFSHKKVQAIGQAYPTPSALMQAFDGLTDEEGKTLVKDLSTNDGAERQCRIGPKSAAELYHVCTQGGDPERKPAAKPTPKAATEQVEERKKKPKAKKSTPKRSNVAAAKKKVRAKEKARDEQSRKADKDSFMLDSDSDDPASQVRPSKTFASMPQSEEWHCPRCTLKNDSEADSCEVCGSPRPIVTTSETSSSTLPCSYDLTQDSQSASDKCALAAEKRRSNQAKVRKTPDHSVLNTSTTSDSQPSFDWADDSGAGFGFDDSFERRWSTSSSKRFVSRSPPNLEEEQQPSKCVDLSQDDDSSVEIMMNQTSPAILGPNVSLCNSETPLPKVSSAGRKSPPGETDTSSLNESKEVAGFQSQEAQDDYSSDEANRSKGTRDNSVDSNTETEPHPMVALNIAPWDDSSDDEHDEPLFVRCRKRQEAKKLEKKLTSGSENDAILQGEASLTSSIRQGEFTTSSTMVQGKSAGERDQVVLDITGEEDNIAAYGNETRGKLTSYSRETNNGTNGGAATHDVEVIEID